MKLKRIHILVALLAFALLAVPFKAQFWRPVMTVVQRIKGRKTVADRVDQYGPAARKRLAPDFEKVGIGYPPEKLSLVGLKKERVLEAWVSAGPDRFRLLKVYPILGASGKPGPKLREGDNQVPEGLYRIESLNPNSMYHLALRLNYPNEFDKANGKRDGRENLGCDIMIHGKTCSIGCLAMGDKAAEELFVLAVETGLENISVILAPVDFRKTDLPSDMPELPEWTDQLHQLIEVELRRLGEDGKMSDERGS